MGWRNYAWDRDDWAIFGRSVMLGAPVAVVLGAGTGILLQTPPPAPPAHSQIQPSPSTITVVPPAETRTRVETETEMPRHSIIEPDRASTLTPAPASPKPSQVQRTTSPVTTTPAPVATSEPSTTTPPTTTPPSVEGSVETSSEPVSYELELDPDPVYRALVADFISRDPLGSTFLEV